MLCCAATLCNVLCWLSCTRAVVNWAWRLCCASMPLLPLDVLLCAVLRVQSGRPELASANEEATCGIFLHPKLFFFQALATPES
jgi:hypothetical protein